MSTEQIPAALTEMTLPEGVKRVGYSSMGLVAFALVAVTTADYDRIALRAEASLDDANSNIVYRSQLNVFRAKVCELLEAETEIARGCKVTNQTEIDKALADIEAGVEGVKEVDAVTEYTESEAKYFKRVCAEQGVEPDAFQHLGDLASAALKFEPATKVSNGPKAKTPTKAAYAVAEKMIADGKAQRLADHLAGPNLLNREIALVDEAEENAAEQNKEILAQAVHQNELREAAIARAARNDSYLTV